MPVDANMSVIVGGITLSKAQPQTLDYEMCERDFRITTCKLTDAIEDLKPDPVTLKEIPWAGPELTLQGVYKDGGATNILCVDQADADANGILTIFNYRAYDQADGTTEISYNIRSGALVIDPLAVNERFAHRAYIVAVPDLGQAYWVRFFDGYIAGRPSEGELSTDSPTAKLLQPIQGLPGANVIRIYIYHPQGQSNDHILWLLTYRPPGTS